VGVEKGKEFDNLFCFLYAAGRFFDHRKDTKRDLKEACYTSTLYLSIHLIFQRGVFAQLFLNGIWKSNNHSCVPGEWCMVDGERGTMKKGIQFLFFKIN
jgi:hypothetical protein